MAFTDPISVNDNSAALQGFTRTGYNPNGSDWVENDATATDVRSLVIRHSNVGSSATPGGKPLRRHLVQFVHSKWNASLGKTEKFVMNLTFTVDPQSALTTTNQYDILAFVKNFLTTTNFDKLVRDES